MCFALHCQFTLELKGKKGREGGGQDKGNRHPVGPVSGQALVCTLFWGAAHGTLLLGLACRAPIIPVETARNYRYGLTGDTPPWRPISVFDDGRRVYVVFPRGIVQGEMPPIFVIGSEGETQIINSRIHQNILIVDRLFGAAELRLGSGDRQQTVRIVRVEPRQAAQPAKTGEKPS